VACGLFIILEKADQFTPCSIDSSFEILYLNLSCFYLLTVVLVNKGYHYYVFLQILVSVISNVLTAYTVSIDTTLLCI